MIRPLAGVAAALVASAASAQPDPRASAVIAAVQSDLGAEGIAPGASYAIAFSDLNDDHRPEALVHLADRNTCGTGGCTTFILVEAGGGWQPIGRMSVSRLPIYRLPEHHEGWFDLGVYVSGGGAQPGIRAVRFGKGRYGSNASKGRPVARLPQQATLLLGPTSEFFPAQ